MRKLARLGIVIGGGVGVFYLALVCWCANEMASPTRRAVNASHLTFLDGTAKKRWIEVPGAGHQNVLVTDFPIYATMARWFLEHAGFPRQCLANMGLRAVRRSLILLPRSSAGAPLDIGIGQDA